jgi:hypothetical protein
LTTRAYSTRPDPVAEPLVVDHRPVALDEARQFQLAHALGHGRLAQVHAAAQLGHGDACVLLQFSQYSGIVRIQFGNFGGHGSLT